MKNPGLNATRIAVVSRCSWTLSNFRTGVLRALMSEGAEVIAMGAGGDGFEQRLRADGITFEDIPLSRRGWSPLADLRLIFVLWLKFHRFKPNIVHTFTIKPAIFATIAASLARVPVKVVTITGLGHAFTTAPPWIRRSVMALYWVTLRHADRVYFQNPVDRDFFLQRKLVRPEAVGLVAGSGIDLKKFVMTELPCRNGVAPSFLMIARLLREKGVAEYVQAAKAVRAEFPDVRFMLLGAVDPRNPSSLSAQEMQQIRAGGGVELLEPVADVRPCIADADIVVLPSYREGLPRSLLEGGAMGRALLTTDAPGCREVVREGLNGHRVPVGDSSALARAMLDMVRNPDNIAAFGANARLIVEAEYDERRIVQQTISTYHELMAESR